MSASRRRGPRRTEGSRRLRAWLEKHGFTQTGTATELGITRAALHRYLNGYRPEPEIMYGLEQLTRGHVRMQHWMRKAVRASDAGASSKAA